VRPGKTDNCRRCAFAEQRWRVASARNDFASPNLSRKENEYRSPAVAIRYSASDSSVAMVSQVQLGLRSPAAISRNWSF